MKSVIRAAVVAFVVAVPVTFLSMRFVRVTGGWLTTLQHSGYWDFYLRAFAWIFLAGFVSALAYGVAASRKWP